MQNPTPSTSAIQSDIQVAVSFSSGGKEFSRLAIGPVEIQSHSIAQALPQFMRGFSLTTNPDEPKNLEVGSTSAAEVQSPKSQLLAVLQDRSKYSRRTKEGLRKTLGAYSDEVFSKTLEQCLLDGSVRKYEGRRATYFFTEAESSATSGSETNGKFDNVGHPQVAKLVYDFLSDKSKYQRRSFDDIFKALGEESARLLGVDANDLLLLLDEMESEDLIGTDGDFYEAT